MYKVECPDCEDYKNGKCIDWECPCMDIPWDECHTKTIEYGKDREVQLNIQKLYYDGILQTIKREVEILYSFSLPFHRGLSHPLADMVQEVRNKILKVIE